MGTRSWPKAAGLEISFTSFGNPNSKMPCYKNGAYVVTTDLVDYCHVIDKFLFYYLDGYQSINIRCVKKNVILKH